MGSYQLHGQEKIRAEKFIKKHKKCKNNDKIGLFSYIFTPNGIGNTVKIHCPYCDEELDITDVSCW
jgi:hypothetical protein